MASYSDILRLTKQADGENTDTWGQVLNDEVIELIEDAIAGTASISTTGGTTVLSTNNGAADQARSAVLSVSGTLASNATIEVPAKSKLYVVRNNTSGAFTLTVKTNAGTGVAVPQGYAQLLYCDGTNVLTMDTVNVKVDKDGRLVLGGGSSRSIGGAHSRLQVEGTSQATARQSITRNSADANGAAFVFGKSRDASLGGVTIVQDNDVLADLDFAAADGVDVDTVGARVRVEVDGTPGANDIPAAIVFYTQTAAGALTERMRIAANGVVTFAGSTVGKKGAAVQSAQSCNIWTADGDFLHISNETGSLSNPFSTTNGSAVVTVADTAHGLRVGDPVVFSGASAVGGITVNGQYSVNTVPNADSYTIVHSSNATSTAGPGGGTVSYEYGRTIDDFGTAPQAGAQKNLIVDGPCRIADNATIDANNGGSTITLAAGDSVKVIADTTTLSKVTVTHASGNPVRFTAANRDLPVLLETITPAAVASVTTAAFPSWVKNVQLRLFGMRPAANSTLNMRIRVAGGGSDKSGASDYEYVNQNRRPNSDLPTTDDDADAQIVFGATAAADLVNSAATAQRCGGVIDIQGVNSTTKKKPMTWLLSYERVNSPTMVRTMGAGSYVGSDEAIEKVTFFFSGGNITSGTIEVWGLP